MCERGEDKKIDDERRRLQVCMYLSNIRILSIKQSHCTYVVHIHRLLDSVVMYIACNSAKFCTRHLYYPFIEQTYAKTFVADMDASKAGITRRVSKNFALSFVTDLVIRTDGDCSTHRIEMKKITTREAARCIPGRPVAFTCFRFLSSLASRLKPVVVES